MTTETWINAGGQEKDDCMYGLYHENPGLRVLNFLVGSGLINRVVGGHT